MAKQPAASAFLGYFDSLDNGIARGWALDRRSADVPTRLHILIDGQEVDRVTCRQSRPDVQTALGLPVEKLGFEYQVPERYFDGGSHTIAIRFADRSIVPFVVSSSPLETAEACTFDGVLTPQFQSFVDGVKQGALRGWILQKHPRTGVQSGNCLVSVTVNGARVAQVRADRYRGDVAAVLGCDPNCGFEFVLPQQFKGTSPQTFSLKVLPWNIELSGSPFTTSVADDALEARLVDIASTIDRLYRELANLRMEIRDAIPKPGYNLGDYDRWARRYYANLRERVARARLEDPLTDRPLVSILCPTYRPLMSDFEAAIQSVIGQTYENWELIIVDDAGKSKETTARIRAFCEQDKRIRLITLAKNAGISGATNVGMHAAKGVYTAFFDHDDMLVDVAIEVMVRAAQKTGARMLYSDEDKIDQAGYFLEPNLKPDFNYRYLLGCNYICHLTMVETALMREVGPLSKTYDGAQDHDFVLRVSETIPAAQIVHVPEVLYHWRKTPNSTAVDVSKKTYAIQAGVACVADHLKRRGLRAKVSSIRGLTLYGVDWQVRNAPKVAIIIPFKDQVDTTRTCVERLLEHTKYRNFEILLVNNWSVTREAEAFIAEMRETAKVRVLDVEEKFNYSRLNNLAVATTDAKYLVFMNNDVFVEQDGWIQTALGEIQAAPDIGAVGAKLLYPNDTIQHAGVAVGPAGIGAHVHRGQPLTEYGYIGRTMLSHEVTAVTAAAMMVRADVFAEVGGFDEIDLTVAYNDVDLCLKIRHAGYRIVFCAEWLAYHHESLSRGTDQSPEHEARFFFETETMRRRWGEHPLFVRDPAYPAFFTVDRQPFFDLVDPDTL
jgi:O-antigen biosynthesis protein